jgi:hypothetical protein
MRPVVSLIGLLVVYYGVPVDVDSARPLAVGGVITAAGLAALAWAITGQVRRQLTGDGSDDIRSLVTLLGLVVMLFSLGFFSLDIARPDEFAGLETRTDALYFTLVSMATVGYGDIHASGQIARVLVIVLIGFNFVFVGALVHVLSGRLHRRVEARSEQHRGE